MSIRAYRSDDLPALQAIRAAAFAPIFAGFREQIGAAISEIALRDADAEQGQLLDSLCGADSRWTMLVLEQNGAPIGFCAYAIDAASKLGEIGLNAVHPDHGGRGFGARLYAIVLDRMKTEGALAATVSTGGDAAHAPARRAYAKVGFSAQIPSVTYYVALNPGA